MAQRFLEHGNLQLLHRQFFGCEFLLSLALCRSFAKVTGVLTM